MNITHANSLEDSLELCIQFSEGWHHHAVKWKQTSTCSYGVWKIKTKRKDVRKQTVTVSLENPSEIYENTVTCHPLNNKKILKHVYVIVYLYRVSQKSGGKVNVDISYTIRATAMLFLWYNSILFKFFFIYFFYRKYSK